MFNKAAILFLVLALSVTALFSLRIENQKATQKLNEHYAHAVAKAVEDAADTMEYDESERNSMGKERVRETVLNTFFNSISTAFGYEMTIELEEDTRPGEYQRALYKHIPVVMLVDNDGYYVWHNTFDENGLIRGKLSSLTTWGEELGSGGRFYYVRYYLGNYVQIREKDTSQIYEGTVEKVYEDMLNDGPVEMAIEKILSSYDAYAVSRNRIVATSIEQTVGYYINNHNTAMKMDAMPDNDYVFTMPQQSGGDWIEMVENPAVISFIQGIKVPDSDMYLNVFAFSGAEYSKDMMYYTNNEDMTYFRNGIDNIPQEGDTP